MIAEHQIHFKETAVLARMTGCMDCTVKQLHPTNFNRDMGFPLSCP
jgi:hypothetical protein